MTTSMRNVLLSLLAVAAVSVVAVVIVENTPERRMDRKLEKLLRTYDDDPKQIFQRVIDDRDLLGFVLVHSFLVFKGLDRCSCDARTSSDHPGSLYHHEEDCDFRSYLKPYQELYADFWDQIGADFCDCGRAPDHREDCNYMRASRDMQKTWGPYIMRKTKEFAKRG